MALTKLLNFLIYLALVSGFLGFFAEFFLLQDKANIKFIELTFLVTHVNNAPASAVIYWVGCGGMLLILLSVCIIYEIENRRRLK